MIADRNGIGGLWASRQDGRAPGMPQPAFEMHLHAQFPGLSQQRRVQCVWPGATLHQVEQRLNALNGVRGIPGIKGGTPAAWNSLEVGGDSEFLQHRQGILLRAPVLQPLQVPFEAVPHLGPGLMHDNWSPRARQCDGGCQPGRSGAGNLDRAISVV